MELRSSRSRSRTPFLQNKHELVVEQKNHINKEVVQHQHTYSTRNKSANMSLSSLSDEVFSATEKHQKSEKIVKRSRQKTSDYSSDDDHPEVNSSSESLKKTISSTNGNVKTPLQIYKEAGDYWNKYPKTDYTYSYHSKDRVELAPGLVALPNMSRRSLLHRNSDHTLNNHQQQYYNDTLKTSNTKKLYNNNIEPKVLFRNETDSYTNITITKRIYTYCRSITTRIYTSIITVLLVITNSCTSSVLWIGREYYKAVSKLLLLDTWLVQSATRYRNWRTLISALVLLLLLLTGWWLWSGISHVLQGVFIQTEPSLLPAPPPNLMESMDEQLAKIILPIIHNTENEEKLNANDIVHLLIKHPEFEPIITRHISALKSEMKAVNERIDTLATNFKLENARTAARFTAELNRCCKRQFIYIESYVKQLLSDLIGIKNIQPGDISKWLQTIFVAKEDLEYRLNQLSLNLKEDLQPLIDASADRIMTQVFDRINLRLKVVANNNYDIGGALTEIEVQEIVKKALAVYDADKTGLVDYALESAGGQVLSTRCTESYLARTAIYSIFNIPLWYPSNTPRIVITPGVVPGECWAFQNFPGFLVIQLSAYINVSAFSLEHIPKSLDPGGRRDSAPKDFTVFGLQQENDMEPFELGKYVYDLDGPSLQYFAVVNKGPAFNLIELRVESNHGNINYTCLYRFRVHGLLSHEPT